MEELIQDVESRVRTLLQKQAELEETNNILLQTKRKLSMDIQRLSSKHKDVVGSIENTIAKLKSIEGMK